MGKFAVLLPAAAFIAVFVGGNRILGGSEAPAPHWNAGVQLAGQEASGPVRHEGVPGAPRLRRVARDMAIARRAVLHRSDVRPSFHPLPASHSDGGCRRTGRDLPRLTVTGHAQTGFAADISLTLSRVQLFPNARQAAAYFRATNNRKELLCIRDFVQAAVTGESGIRVAYARIQHTPQLGGRTAIYLMGFQLRGTSGGTENYPVEVLSVQVGRAVVNLFYAFIYSPDGSRPCDCELRDAAKVVSRLARAGVAD
jgi:hypothetical protein